MADILIFIQWTFGIQIWRTEEAQWSAFKPQANLAPVLLDTGASHLEVMTFSEAIETYIVTGFRGVGT